MTENESANETGNESGNGAANEPTKIENIYRILIVDDEREVLNALRRTLLYAKQFKSEITGVENGEKALAELKERQFDLILADYRMPGMTGTELLNIVRDKYPHTIRIIVTGYSDIEIIKEAINKAEIHYYIEKPWDNENVRSIVDEALKRRKKRDLDDKGESKRKILNWLMDIYNDLDSIGLDLSFIDQNIQQARNALDSNDWENALNYVNQSVNTLTQFAEISNPKLRITLIGNVQLPAHTWSKLNIEIFNEGTTNAIDIQIKAQGELKLKELEPISVLKVNDRESLTLEVYPEGNGTFQLDLEILCKKPFDNSEYTFEQKFWIQVGEVAGKTRLKRSFGYYRGYIKMELNVINEDLRDIREVNFEVEYDKDKLRLSHINPNYKLVNNKFQLGDLKSQDGRSVEVYFDPQSCTDTIISGKVEYLNYNNNRKDIAIQSQKIRILSPVLSSTDNIGRTELANLLKVELKHTGSKVISLPMGMDNESMHRICKDLAFKFKTKMVDEIVEHNPETIELWFYGATEDKKNKFAIKMRIDEVTSTMELSVSGANNAAITGLLTNLLVSLSTELQDQGIIQQPIRQIENFPLKVKIISSRRSLFFAGLSELKKNLGTDYAKRIRERSQNMANKFETLSKREIVGVTKTHTGGYAGAKGSERSN
jgi:CheY-like chemotaxis protein